MISLLSNGPRSDGTGGLSATGRQSLPSRGHFAVRPRDTVPTVARSGSTGARAVPSRGSETGSRIN
jgi:hypothetical protein